MNSQGNEYCWDRERVQALRRWLHDSQTELADRLGTRQQTVSAWETGSSQPRRMSQRLLGMVAKESGYSSAVGVPVQTASANRILNVKC
jgi:DNA-binding transcriptional regulator YiaG